MLGVITLNQSFLLPCISYKVPAILSCTSTKQTKIKNQVTKCTKTGHEARNTNTREVTNPTGFNNFVRENPNSDKFTVKNFHHIEFWCNGATNTGRRFSWGLGMPIASKSDLSTGNLTHASYLLTSGEVNFLFTTPYSPTITTNAAAFPTFSYTDCHNFTASHGLAVRAIAIEVEDAELAFNVSVANGAKPSSPPVILGDSEVVLRFISYNKNKNVTFLPLFEPVEKTSSFPELDYGIRSLDHAVGNVQKLAPAVEYMKLFTGFHEFAEFTAEDFKKIESETNFNIQTYLEHNEGAGVHHLALATEDTFRTLKEMRKRSSVGGFEFMSAPLLTYYRNLKKRVGDVLSDEHIKEFWLIEMIRELCFRFLPNLLAI
ncbi:4-hydroxyphenylpyruvate dioxygenase, partial [Tanacetum coccineum]